MPTLAFSGALRSTKNDIMTELGPLGPALAVKDEVRWTIEDLGPGDTADIPLGPLEGLAWVSLNASAPVVVTLTKSGPTAVGPFRVMNLLMVDTMLIAPMSVQNTSEEAVKLIEIVLGGPKVDG